jgi:hypothetical protein
MGLSTFCLLTSPPITHHEGQQKGHRGRFWLCYLLSSHCPGLFKTWMASRDDQGNWFRRLQRAFLSGTALEPYLVNISSETRDQCAHMVTKHVWTHTGVVYRIATPAMPLTLCCLHRLPGPPLVDGFSISWPFLPSFIQKVVTQRFQSRVIEQTVSVLWPIRPQS